MLVVQGGRVLALQYDMSSLCCPTKGHFYTWKARENCMHCTFVLDDVQYKTQSHSASCVL